VCRHAGQLQPPLYRRLQLDRTKVFILWFDACFRPLVCPRAHQVRVPPCARCWLKHMRQRGH
jgi:hypothetical protein